MWGLVKHFQSICCIECSPDPLGSIRAAEVLWHQCDRINTSKAESGPTAASHSQYSTFHVLLRFTTISRKPAASQTEKDNGPTCRYHAFPGLQWNMSNFVFDERLEFNRLKSGNDIWLCHMAGMQRSIWVWHSSWNYCCEPAWFYFSWCKHSIFNVGGKLNPNNLWGVEMSQGYIPRFIILLIRCGNKQRRGSFIMSSRMRWVRV